MKTKIIRQGMLIAAAAFGLLLFAAHPAYAKTTLKEDTPVYMEDNGTVFHVNKNCKSLNSDSGTKMTLAQALKKNYEMCKTCAEEIQLDEATRSRLSVDLLPYTTNGTISDSSNSGSNDTTPTSTDTASNDDSKTNNNNDASKSNDSKAKNNSDTAQSDNSNRSKKSNTTAGNSSRSSSSSSSGKELMTQSQRKKRFWSKTNPKRGEKPVTTPRAASAGFSYADFATYNSYNSDNHLGGTPIYLLGTIMDMQPVKEDGSQYTVAVMVNDCDGYQWYMRVKCDKSKYDLMKSQLSGKAANIYGQYSGYSGVTNRPMMDIGAVFIIGGSGINMSAYQ